MSVRSEAITEIRARLTRIRTANGFLTEVGQQLFVGERPTLGPGDPVATIALQILEDEVGHQGEHIVSVVPVTAEAIVQADADDPWSTVEAVIADIKKAIETDLSGNRDYDLSGKLVRHGLERGPTAPLDREEGSVFVGAGVTYRLMLRERWGAP
jgi:hypothetical protein